MKFQFAIALSLPVIIGLTGCDKIGSMTKKGGMCGDEQTITLVNSLLEKEIQSQVKSMTIEREVKTDSSGVRASISQLDLAIEDVRTSKKDPNSTKEFCSATLNVGFNSDMIKKTNFVRDYYGQEKLDEEAFQQGFDMEGNNLSYELDYSVQPTDKGEKAFGDLQNGDELISFIAEAIVDSIQKNEVQAMKARDNQAQDYQDAEAIPVDSY